MNKYKPTLGEVAVKSGLAGKDTAEKEPRLDVCKIAHGQDQGHAGCGVLVYDQKVDENELSKHCIITINEVVNSIENKIFEKGKYKVTFRHKNKQFDLRNVTKVVRNASGLALIFINPSCKELKKCSILSESSLSIAAPDHCSKSSLFCFIENQRYNVVESTGENREEGVYVLEPDSKTAMSACDSPKEIPHGTVILQYDAGDKSLMAVGIFKVVSKEHMKISPIWFKSSLKDLLAETPAPPKEPEIPANFEPDGPSPSPAGSVTANAETPAPPKEPEIPANLEPDGPSPSPAGSVTANAATPPCSTDSGEPSTTNDTVAANTTDGPQSTVSSRDTPADTTDNQGLPAAGSDTTEVADQLISKAVTNDEILLEKLSKKLDRESRHIRCWKHLACVLDVPVGERRKFARYTEHSPTEDMFNYLADVWKPDLKVKDLKRELKDIYRNDVIQSLNEAKYDDNKRVSGLVSDNGKFIAMLSSMLDTGENGWRSLASQLRIKPEISAQFGLPGQGPTAELFFYMSTTDGLKDLTIVKLREHFKDMEQNALVNLLQKYEDSSLVSKEAAADSELLEAIGKCLNKNIRGVKNWRNLAYRLGITSDVYNTFDTSKEVEQGPSPTEMLFKWLERGKPKLTVKDLLNCLRKIERFDVVELVIKEVADALKKKKTQVYLTEQALYKLQLLRHDTDQAKKDKNVLLADLREKAAGQGLTLIDNDGLGNCMFSALCHQLKIKKRLKQYSEMELRTELAQYLKAHPELNDFVDQKEYPTWTDYVNKMASNGHWGDGVTLLAAARHLHCDVRVISNRDYPDVFLKPDSSNCDGEQLVQLVLGHIFEDHFVSLEPVH